MKFNYAIRALKARINTLPKPKTDIDAKINEEKRRELKEAIEFLERDSNAKVK